MHNNFIAPLKYENSSLNREVVSLRKKLAILEQSRNSNPPQVHSTPSAPPMTPCSPPSPPAHPCPSPFYPPHPSYAPTAPPMTPRTHTHTPVATPQPPFDRPEDFPPLPTPKRGYKTTTSVRQRPPHTFTNPISLENRYSILGEITEDANDSIVIQIEDEINNDPDINVYGDSLVRSLGKEISNKKRNHRGHVHVSPGANINRITDIISHSTAKDKNSCLVSCVGSNDVYQKKAASEHILQRYRQLIKSMKQKSSRCFVVGILPRPKANAYELSRAIGINSRLDRICKESNVVYIDTWNTFGDNRSLFKGDKIHLNNKGTEKLGGLINSHISCHLKVGNFQIS